MKKLIAALTLVVSLLIASPTFAYTVKTGDTMSKIATANNLPMPKLVNLNSKIENIDLIDIGRRVSIAKKSKTQTKIKYSKEEINLLARLVRAEAQSEPYKGKVAVACVVLNRVASKSFPDNIRDVIYQKGQFQPVHNGEINKPADEDSIKAVYEALTQNRNMAGRSLFFYNPVIATSHWLDSRATTLVIGHHVFKK